MDTTKLKNFAQKARINLLSQIETQLNIVLTQDSLARRESPSAIASLEEKIQVTSKEDVIEQVSYIWFNRFCALRFMDVNRYNNVGIITPAINETLPEILSDAISGHIEETIVNTKTKQRVRDLLLGNIPSQDAQAEAYKLLLVSYCNSLSTSIPFLFGRIEDYVEILIPSNLLSKDSILSECREAMDVDSCKDVEVIGWLYQYYISEKKDEVFKSFKKKKKAGPKEIPAATQLFTPHWIVKYLVENSIGRLWMLNNPDSLLVDQMEYYIKPVEKIDDFLHISSPEEIKVNDPACGSGHMLTYAFDILYYIYEEQGYNPRTIPTLILQNNLFGVEIDERAGEMAAFALLMKARAKDRRFLNKPIKPNICKLKNISFEENEINDYKLKVGSDILTSDIIYTLNQFEETDNFGSLIIPKATNIKKTLEKLSTLDFDTDFFIQETHKKVIDALTQAEYLSKKYHVVIANPPYMGGSNMNPRLSSWLKKNYPNSKSDLCDCFIERNLKLILNKGMISMITMQSWMFLSSFEKLRDEVLSNNTILSMSHFGTRAFNSIGGEVVSTTAFIITNELIKKYKGEYIRLVDDKDEESKWLKLLEAIKNPNCGWFYRVSADNFKKIPGNRLAYWVDDNQINSFNKFPKISEFATSSNGIQTGNNARYLRLWNEVPNNKINIKWYPYNKGGQYRKWYGNYEYFINWENNGRAIKKEKNHCARGEQFYFSRGLTWSDITSGKLSCRILPQGFLFDASGPSAFFEDKSIVNIGLALLNTNFANIWSKIFNPTLHFQSGDFREFTLAPKFVSKKNIITTKELICLGKKDWDSYETSWDFTIFPLLDNEYKTNSISETYNKVRSHWNDMTLEMQRLEEENNKIFIEAYGLEDELTPEVPLKEITLTCNPHYRYGNNKTTEELEALLLADTMKEYISYAVGCMFGRYSIDKPGLILANQGETYEDYCKLVPNSSFPADIDNVIPILDDEWFSDDIVYRFKNFVRVTFGDEKYYDNLRFIEDSIGKDIRTYFLKDFYNDHIKRYKKRPIYWMFSSPNGGFNTLIYMHRYQNDTVGIVRSNYLLEYISKISTKIEHLDRNQSNINLSKSEKTKALKEEMLLKKRLDELEKYERDIMYKLASDKIEIDLDDGVKVNYNKFGKALKKVTGLSAK